MDFIDYLKKYEFFYLDGGFGTVLQSMDVEIGLVPEVLNITKPEIMKKVSEEYAKAGAMALYTPTFSANSYKVRNSGYTSQELIKAGVANTREVANKYGCLVALDIGPIGRLVEPNGDLTFEEAYDIYKEQILAGSDADFIVIETQTDLYEARIALLAAKENSNKPVICTMSFEANGRTFTGSTVSGMALTLEGLGADAIGFNCSLGPVELKPLVEELSKWTSLPIVVKANAGLPDPETGKYLISPSDFTKAMADLVPYGVKILGGCCGTNPEYIREIRKAFNKLKYNRQEQISYPAVTSPEKTVVIDRPRIIGERLNPTGKKKLKEALARADMDYVVEEAIRQVEEGAEILDINVGSPGINEVSTMKKVIKALAGVISVPLQIDSNKAEVVETALRHYCGKAIINSVSGDKASMEKIIPLAKKYGACLVGLTLDEEGIPKTVDKRIEIARKILGEVTKAGIEKKNLFIDPLTLTLSAEQENAMNTLTALKRVKEELGLKTVLGVSNISFGLPNRNLINYNFLQMALLSGLDLPIMNPGAREMVAAVDVYKVVANIDKKAVDFIEKYGNVQLETREVAKGQGVVTPSKDGKACKGESSEGGTTSPSGGAFIDEKAKKLAFAIENGLDDRCKSLVKEILEEKEPMDVVNNIMIPILDKAGDDFERGRIFIPQLIMTAGSAQVGFEVIKEKLLENGGTSQSMGKIVVATVKGDVHDIGKNIVKVILENYGYEIVDLGKDVDPEKVLEAARDEDVRLVGLSALMTTTLPNMEYTVKLIKEELPEMKIMVGGAVLTEEYAMKMGADFYVKDAKASCDASKEVYGE